MKQKKSLAKTFLDPIFRPRSIAVVGASRSRGSIGREILHNLIDYGFNGMVFPVNPKASVVHSIKCYRSVLEVPEEIDLAVVVVPRPLIMRVVEECGLKGVKGLVVITAGFKEVGEEGAELEEELKERVKKYGMRMVGPNCMGIINTDPDTRLDATFAATFPISGNVGFMSQSGALGVAILDHARMINLGFSMFASMGNKLDISGNDLLEYWEHDKNTDVILLYLESFGNPRRFTKLARRVVRKKPIIAVKAGRTRAGARAASSHTGAIAGLDMATEALFEQCGVLRVNSVEELFDLAQAFAHQPIPQGNRIAILTNAGGPGIMATDACVNLGLKMAKLSDQSIAKLKSFCVEEASLTNPIDMVAGAGAGDYSRALEILLKDGGVDGVIVIFVHPITIDPFEVAEAIVEINRKKFGKPILCCFMGREDESSGIGVLRKNNLPVYLFPESAALALSAMTKYRDIRDREPGKVRTFPVDKKVVRDIITGAQSEGREHLSEGEVEAILKAYGLPMPKSKLVIQKEEAVAFADGIGYPVVLKLISTQVIHKSDVGGVVLDIRNRRELEQGFEQILKGVHKLGDRITDFQIMVQEMVKGGKETIIGMSIDPHFGPLIMFGLGGIYVETIKDINFRIHPITDREALDMVESLKSYPLLQGVRGEPPVDIGVVTESIQRVSQLVGDFTCIRELDINPFIVFPERDKCKAVDARIRIKRTE